MLGLFLSGLCLMLHELIINKYICFQANINRVGSGRILFVCRTQRGAKDWSETQSMQGQTSIKRYFYYPSFSYVSLDRFERKSVSTLSIFCLRVRVKLFEAIYLSAGRFSYNNDAKSSK
jgi:hypothetical protein